MNRTRFVTLLLSVFFGSTLTAQVRSLGLDVSAWQGNISQSTWNNIYNVENRDFVFIRSSRGGTSGFYNQSDPNNNNGLNTLSQRYDDPYFVQNITRATNAGMYAGGYHFSRPDIVASTQNSGGIANSGADEADHFIEMAGAWMRPGYLLPVHDLEAGDGARSDNDMAQFALDFSNRVHEVMGIRPAIYINGNYANFVIGGASPSLRNQVVETYPVLWSARWPNQANPDAIPVQTGHPKDSYAPIYGPWDDPPRPVHPWSFWQYASTGRLNSFNNGNSNLDFNVAQGGIEFIKDNLVPAVWLSDSDGDWSQLGHWNSGQVPIAPVQGPGQVQRVGPLTLPDVRLPGADDTVVLDRSNADVSVSLTQGDHAIRKLDVHETLDISGGSLSLNYVPTVDSTSWSARVSGAISVTETGTLSAHAIDVEAGALFTLGNQLTFGSLNLGSDGSQPARLAVVDDVRLSPWSGQTAIIESLGGGFMSGQVDLQSVNRTWQIDDGSSVVDVRLDVPIVGGSLFKAGAGTMQLSAAADYGGDIVVLDGRLVIDAPLIDDSSSVFLSAGSNLNLNFSGVDQVASAYLDGVSLAPGTWGAPGSGADFVITAFSGSGQIRVTSSNPILAGDFDGDGIVDAADFTVWRDALGQTGLNPFAAGDGNGDGAVTLDDLDVWRDNFGATTEGLVSMVPEPGGSAMMLIFSGWLWFRFRCGRT